MFCRRYNWPLRTNIRSISVEWQAQKHEYEEVKNKLMGKHRLVHHPFEVSGSERRKYEVTQKRQQGQARGTI